MSEQLSAISLNRAPSGSPNTKGNGSSDLRCVVFLGSPYGANPSTAGLWESAPKGGVPPPGAAFFWVPFSGPRKESPPAGGQPPTSPRRPRGGSTKRQSKSHG